MAKLNATLIDVGWGDSILIEFEDQNVSPLYGLIDSNDTSTLRSSYIFLKKFFERKGITIEDSRPLFEFVLLSHAHTDHGQGLKAILREFGTKNFWYPQSLNWSSMADLIRFANQSPSVEHHQSIDDTKIFQPFGQASRKVLWPPRHHRDPNSENNNSVVLSLCFNNVTFIFTGDAEESVWGQIANIPANTQFFKVPHHGSRNGTFDSQNNTPWFNNCPSNAKLGISSHVRPFSHPHQDVVDLFNSNSREFYRTDEHYHVTFSTDGTTTNVKYSH